MAGVMPAHVIYAQADPEPAGYSRYWLQEILRGKLGFDGLIFSDDLSMEGASVAGGIVERANAAWAAGCDMLLVCNAPDSVGELLDHWRPMPDPHRTPYSARAGKKLGRAGDRCALPERTARHRQPDGIDPAFDRRYRFASAARKRR